MIFWSNNNVLVSKADDFNEQTFIRIGKSIAIKISWQVRKYFFHTMKIFFNGTFLFRIRSCPWSFFRNEIDRSIVGRGQNSHNYLANFLSSEVMGICYYLSFYFFPWLGIVSAALDFMAPCSAKHNSLLTKKGNILLVFISGPPILTKKRKKWLWSEI